MNLDCKCDICGGESVETVAAGVGQFKIRGELRSHIYALFLCENGDYFYNTCETVVKESSMNRVQLEKFAGMKESKTHYSMCSLSNPSCQHPYYDDECHICDPINEKDYEEYKKNEST